MPIYKRTMKQADIAVGDLMITPPSTISEKGTVEDAAKIMWEKRFGSVMVVNKSGKLVGIVTERDVIFAVTRSMIGKNVRVSDLMSRNLITVGPNESVMAAVERMRQANVRHLPVMNKSGRPVGMISIRDVLDAGASLMRILIPWE